MEWKLFGGIGERERERNRNYFGVIPERGLREIFYGNFLQF